MSEDPALDRRLPVPRKSRAAGIYVAYSIAGALILGAGGLSLGHLSSYRPSASSAAMAGQVASKPPAPPSPAVLAQAQPPAPAPSVTVKMPEPKAAEPPPVPPAASAPAEPPKPVPVPPPAATALPGPPPLAAPGFATPPPTPPAIAAGTNDAPPVNLIAANGLPLPPPEKPPAPVRRVGLCPSAPNADDLLETSPAGRLPRVAGNGCMPWLAYAGEFDHLDRQRPRLGIAVIGIGLNQGLTQKAIETLPPATTLVFVPETPNLDRWIQRARERGMEALLLMPSQNPQGAHEPGMPPLQKSLPPAENVGRLRAVLAKAQGYVGVALLPSPVLEDRATISPVLAEIRDRGLLVLEFERWNGKSQVHAISREMGIPYSTDIDSPIAWVDRFDTDDRQTTARDVDNGLGEVEKFVRQARFGLGWSLARPLSIERIAAWSAGLRTRGILLAPVTGVTECAENCQKRLPRAPQPPAPAPTR